MDFASHPAHVQCAINCATSLDWVVVGVRSDSIADLAYLARHHGANELLDLTGPHHEVRLDVDNTAKFKAKVLADALGTPDFPEVERFFAHPSEMLVVCTDTIAAYHTWPRIQFS